MFFYLSLFPYKPLNDTHRQNFQFSTKIYRKFDLVFLLTQEKAFSERFQFNANGKSRGSTKKILLWIFKIVSVFRDRHVFMWQPLEISNIFNTLTLKQIFWETKTFFKKLEYHFLVENDQIERASFPNKSTQKPMLREVEWVQNGVQNGSITKNGVFASNCFIFWKFCFCQRSSLAELIWCTRNPNVHIHNLRKRWSFIWGCNNCNASAIKQFFPIQPTFFMFQWSEVALQWCY